MDRRSTAEVVQNHWWELRNDQLDSDWNRVGQTNYRSCMDLRSFEEIHVRLPLQKMKKHFNCKLLYSDTDSFVYEIFSNDFFADLKRKTAVKDLFDFSNFPTNHDMYDQSNASVTLKFKHEMGGKTISEFVGLKPKLYFIKLADG